MVIFHSYVSLPEGILIDDPESGWIWPMRCKIQHDSTYLDCRLIAWSQRQIRSDSVPRMSLREDEEDERKCGTLVALRLGAAWVGLKCSAHALVIYDLPSGKLTKSYWKWPSRNSGFFPMKHGGSFHSYVAVYQAGYLKPRKDKALLSIQQRFGCPSLCCRASLIAAVFGRQLYAVVVGCIVSN